MHGDWVFREIDWGAWSKRIRLRLTAEFQSSRPEFSLWIPVFLGIGVGMYFAIPVFIPPALSFGLFAITVIAAILMKRAHPFFFIVVAIGCVFLGVWGAGQRAERVDSPRIDRETAPLNITAEVARIERLPGGHRRLTILPHEIQSFSAEKTPARVRLIARTGGDVLTPGDIVEVRAVLMPLPGPVVPGGFDYGLQAWFQQIGAGGFTTTPVLKIGEGSDTFDQAIARVRDQVATRIRARIPGERGGIAAALLTGHRDGIPEPIAEALRHTGLAHLLAISGLHIGLVTAILFVTFRGTLALSRKVSLQWPIREIAAFSAWGGAFGYFLLAGATVPTQRAFLTASVVLFAVLIGRQALSLRLVAFAATVILLVSPEALLSVSFQMSFAAVIGLVVAYRAIDRKMIRTRGKGLVAGGYAYLVSVLLSTIIASVATAPFAIYHFNHLSVVGSLANLVAVPVVALWVMPLGILALVLMPVGMDGFVLDLMAVGVGLVIETARALSEWPASYYSISSFPATTLVGLVFACFMLILLRGQFLRVLAIVPVGVAFIAWLVAVPPDILISRDGRLVAIRGAEGNLKVSSTRRGRYAQERWQAQFGLDDIQLWSQQDRDDSEVENSPPAKCDGSGCVANVSYGNQEAMILAMPETIAAFAEDCRNADIIILQANARVPCPEAMLVFTPRDFYVHGAHALWLNSNGSVSVKTVEGLRGDKPWATGR